MQVDILAFDCEGNVPSLPFPWTVMFTVLNAKFIEFFCTIL